MENGLPPDSQAPPDDYDNRRSADRFAVAWSVDCQTGDTFLYASIRNISELGIFVATREPLALGTRVTLRFAPSDEQSFILSGVVQWINPLRLLADNRDRGAPERPARQFVDETRRRHAVADDDERFAHGRTNASGIRPDMRRDSRAAIIPRPRYARKLGRS